MTVIELISALQVLVTNYPNTGEMPIVHEGAFVDLDDTSPCSVDFIVVGNGRVMMAGPNGPLADELRERQRTKLSVESPNGMGFDIQTDIVDDTSRERMSVASTKDGD